MPECYASSQRVDSLARVVITPVRHTHTRLHTPLSNICSSPSSIQHTRGLNSSIFLHTHAFFTATVLATNLEYPTRALQARRTDIGRHCGFSSDLYLNKYNYLLNIKHSSRLASEGACSVTTRLFLSIPGSQPVSVHQTLHDVTTQVTLANCAGPPGSLQDHHVNYWPVVTVIIVSECSWIIWVEQCVILAQFITENNHY